MKRQESDEAAAIDEQPALIVVAEQPPVDDDVFTISFSPGLRLPDQPVRIEWTDSDWRRRTAHETRIVGQLRFSREEYYYLRHDGDRKCASEKYGDILIYVMDENGVMYCYRSDPMTRTPPLEQIHY